MGINRKRSLTAHRCVMAQGHVIVSRAGLCECVHYITLHYITLQYITLAERVGQSVSQSWIHKGDAIDPQIQCALCHTLYTRIQPLAGFSQWVSPVGYGL